MRTPRPTATAYVRRRPSEENTTSQSCGDRVGNIHGGRCCRAGGAGTRRKLQQEQRLYFRELVWRATAEAKGLPGFVQELPRHIADVEREGCLHPEGGRHRRDSKRRCRDGNHNHVGAVLRTVSRRKRTLHRAQGTAGGVEYRARGANLVRGLDLVSKDNRQLNGRGCCKGAVAPSQLRNNRGCPCVSPSLVPGMSAWSPGHALPTSAT